MKKQDNHNKPRKLLDQVRYRLTRLGGRREGFAKVSITQQLIT